MDKCEISILKSLHDNKAKQELALMKQNNRGRVNETNVFYAKARMDHESLRETLGIGNVALLVRLCSLRKEGYIKRYVYADDHGWDKPRNASFSYALTTKGNKKLVQVQKDEQ